MKKLGITFGIILIGIGLYLVHPGLLLATVGITLIGITQDIHQLSKYRKDRDG